MSDRSSPEGSTPRMGALPDGVISHGDPELPVGSKVGEYEVVGLLGEGGFGAVYRAMHPIIGKPAAIKVLKREFSSKPEMVARFISEARAVNQIRHKNIIDIFSFGVLDDGRQFFVMELLDGVTLDAYLERSGPLSVAQAMPILRQLAKALGAAHAAGITHRDIKPENVFLTFDDEQQPVPKLLDFGIAKLVVDKASQHKTRSGVPMGTPLYMSPEQVHGRDIDSRSDIYSFGIMCFEMLTGRVPFDGDSMMDVMMKQLTAAPPAPSALNPSLTPAVDEAVLSMLRKEPDSRPTSIIGAVDAISAASGIAVPLASPSQRGVTPAHFTPIFSQPPISVTSRTPGELTAAAIGAGDTLIASEAPRPSAMEGAKPKPKLAWVWIPLVLGLGVVGVFAYRGLGATPVATVAPPPAPTTASAPPPTATLEVTPAAASETATPTPPSTTVKFRLSSQPPDAEVFQGEKRLGKTGETFELPRGDAPVLLTVKKSGFQNATVEFIPKESGGDAVILKSATRKEYDF